MQEDVQQQVVTLGKRVGKIEDDVGDIKTLIRGYWDGPKRVPGILDILDAQGKQNATILDEITKRDAAHAQMVKAAWGVVRPVVIGVVMIVCVQIAILVARSGALPLHLQ